MYCPKCGLNVGSTQNYCNRCGTKLNGSFQTLRQLRLEENRAKWAFKDIPEYKECDCAKMLRDFCWRQAANRYHPSENKYRNDTPFIPDSAFDEIKVTQEKAIDLFKFLAKITRYYFELQEQLPF